MTKKILNDSSANNLVLAESYNSLSEVVVTGYGTKEKEDLTETVSTVNDSVALRNENNYRVTISNAKPVNGWKAFNKYVTDSLKTLAQFSEESESTEVMVLFDVNEKGEAINITAEKSSCDPCATEAIRFIKNSSHWKLNSKRKKAYAVVRF